MVILAVTFGEIAEIASAIAAFIALWLSYKAIKETQKINEAVNRPFIVPYISLENEQVFLCVKNFGASAGIITSCKIDDKIYRLSFGKNVAGSTIPAPFSYLVGTTFPPGYRVVAKLNRSTVIDDVFFEHNDNKDAYIFRFYLKYKSESGIVYDNKNTDTVNFGVLAGYNEHPE